MPGRPAQAVQLGGRGVQGLGLLPHGLPFGIQLLGRGQGVVVVERIVRGVFVLLVLLVILWIDVSCFGVVVCLACVVLVGCLDLRLLTSS